jgi:uncharacterized tellurite resistance protein B-like protein
MPVIVLIASTLIFWLIYWFVRMDGLDHVREHFRQRRDAARRIKARETERTAPLSATEDPREAAIVLMLLITRGGDPTPAQVAAIQDKMRTVFSFDHDVNDRLTHARFTAGRAQNFAEAAILFAPLFNKQLTADERRELVGMVEEIARIDGGTSATQTDAIDVLKRKVGLAQPPESAQRGR